MDAHEEKTDHTSLHTPRILWTPMFFFAVLFYLSALIQYSTCFWFFFLPITSNWVLKPWHALLGARTDLQCCNHKTHTGKLTNMSCKPMCLQTYIESAFKCDAKLEEHTQTGIHTMPHCVLYLVQIGIGNWQQTQLLLSVHMLHPYV